MLFVITMYKILINKGVFMKKILLTILLFLAICIPSFSVESISVPDININEAKKIITQIMIYDGWTFKNETEYLLGFEKTGSTYVSPSASEWNMYKYLNAEHPDRYYTQPTGHYESYTINRQFMFKENNGVTITADSSEFKEIFKIVFTGYYTYNIEYKIPLFKKQVIITDTPQTNYTGMNRISKKTKIIKINDKNVKDYTEKEIKNIFNNCPEEKLKLESDSGKVYYILRTFIEPTYKQYL